MVTVRTYWSPADAALAKSVLDNYEIRNALLDENSNLSARGAQFAVPIRLVVDEDDVDRAICILNNDFEKAAEIESAKEVEAVEQPAPPEKVNRNPWELLMVAFYLALPAASIIWTKFAIHPHARWANYLASRITIARFLSWLFLLVAVILVVVYFRIRRSATEQTALQK